MKYHRSTTLLLIIFSLIKAVFTGRAHKPLNRVPQRVLAMVLTSNVGDMIFATTVFRAIKEKYPHTHLSVVGSKKNAITLAGNKDIDTYIPTPQSVWTLISILRKSRAEYGFTLATSTFDIASMFLAGVDSIACFNVQNAPGAHTRSYNLLKTLCIQVPYYIGKYCSQEYLRILEPINIFSTNTSKYLFYKEETAHKVNELYAKQGIDLKHDKIVAISPGAGTKAKLWPAERFAQAADFLTENGFKIAVIGGPGDKEEVATFKANLQKTKEVIDASALTLEEMMYFISTCKILMANDSGPVYMAEAFGVATLVVVGPTDEFEHPPHGPRNAVVTPDREVEAPEMRGHIVGYSEEKAREQIDKVTVEQVLGALGELIKRV